ncbi:glycosyltransferase family 2 protein [Parafilimonas sp.]|uniref:glycosyltransferase family 2 protein n=1 Tax=Parafilimonas sp. TaxID=1969739 RepID=UPI0039E3E1A1
MDRLIPAKTLTAIILTWNEEDNIARALHHLTWLEKIIVVDSGSTDKTVGLINSFPNTEVYVRKFDTHARQWNYGLGLCNSEWVLSLDADYMLSYAFIEEVKQKLAQNHACAFNAEFEFVLFKRPLASNNTTPRPVLFKRSACIYYDDGHTQRLRINGKTAGLENKILHDDRKPLSRWLLNQSAYSLKEANMLVTKPEAEMSFLEKLRKKRIYTPLLMFFFCLIGKRMIFNGQRGWHYTLQRTIVEMLISLRLTEEKINKK